MIVPPFLKESIVSVDDEVAEIRYQVDNPGYFTYQVSCVTCIIVERFVFVVVVFRVSAYMLRGS